MPSATAIRTGNPKVQKTASGSRVNPTMRARSSSRRELRIAQPPSGERDKDILERGVVRRQSRERKIPLLQQADERGDGDVRFLHRELLAARDRAHRGDAGNRGERGVVDRAP